MDSGTTEAPTEAPPSSTSPPPSKSPPPSSPAPPADDISSPPPPPPADDSSPPPPVTSNTAAPSPRSLGHTPKSPSSGTSSGSSSVTSSGSSSNSSSKHNHMHDLIIPVVVGALIGIGVLLLVGMFVYLCTRKKRKSSIEDGRYHKGQVSEPRGKVGGDYYKTPPAQHSPAKWQYPSPRGDQRGTFSPVARVGSPLGMKAQPFLPASEEPSVYSGSHGTNSALPSALPSPRPPRAFGSSKPSFTYEELAAATGGFVEANLIGQGGFGYVHKGVLPNGKEIAVKSLKKGSGQGDREFQAEVEIISRVHHRHLVSLVGYSISGGQRLLVYEFIPNNTLEFHLHGKGNPPMDWHTRLKIARGAAKGFAYLHEDCHPRIIHRDIKAANILLDFNFDAKVADFGLAKLTSDNNTHVSTRVMGTFGYLAPEYASSGKLTEKSDVFSYGVMLLELISGRRPVDVNGDMEDSLVDWARPLCTKALETGKFDELVDPFMEGNYNPQEMARMVACAAAAVRHSSKRRPKMSQIVRGLEGDMSLDNLKEWVKGVGQHSTLSGSTSASTLCGSPDMENSNIYSLDMRQIRKTALESIECTSPSSGSAKTSEYGLDTPSSNSEEMRKNKNGNHGRTPSSSSGEVTPKVPSRNPDV